MPIQAVMFDLDGTLADTLDDLATAANHALTHVGRPTYPTDRYRTLVGRGLDRLMQDALGPSHQDLFAPAREAFLAYYTLHRYDRTAPYPGIADLLDRLVQADLRLAVMSNKPDEATRDMVEKVFGRWSFDAARGHVAGYPVKPDPTAPLEIAEQLQIPARDWAYVGDTDVDMFTGKAAGFFTVGVTWGFRDEAELQGAGADAIIHQPAQLLPLLR